MSTDRWCQVSTRDPKTGKACELSAESALREDWRNGPEVEAGELRAASAIGNIVLASVATLMLLLAIAGIVSTLTGCVSDHRELKAPGPPPPPVQRVRPRSAVVALEFTR